MSSESTAGTTENSSLTIQFLGRRTWCGRIQPQTHRMILLLEDLDGLSRFQKITLMNRFIVLLEDFSYRATFFSWTFNIGRFIVTVGSLIVPAMLSIQYTGSTTKGADVSLQIYWTTWTLSLLVTMCNGILTLFKLDKKYYFLNTVLEQLQSEMWQYIHLTGKYAGKYCPGKLSTHDNQYIFFCHNMEKIKLKQVEEEYFKLIESKETVPPPTVDGGQTAPTSQTIAGLFTPTPEQQKLLQHRQELAQALLETQTDSANGNTVVQQVSTPPDIDTILRLESLPNLVENASLFRKEAPKNKEKTEESKETSQQNTQGRGNTSRSTVKVSVQ